jgi:hypothetical protein
LILFLAEFGSADFVVSQRYEAAGLASWAATASNTRRSSHFARDPERETSSMASTRVESHTFLPSSDRDDWNRCDISPFPTQTAPLSIPRSATSSATDTQVSWDWYAQESKGSSHTSLPWGGSSIRQAPTRTLEGNFRRGLCESGIRRVGASACRGTGALSRPRIRRSSTNTRAHGLT